MRLTRSVPVTSLKLTTSIRCIRGQLNVVSAVTPMSSYYGAANALWLPQGAIMKDRVCQDPAGRGWTQGERAGAKTHSVEARYGFQP
jgi:hypothetical protein